MRGAFPLTNREHHLKWSSDKRVKVATHHGRRSSSIADPGDVQSGGAAVLFVAKVLGVERLRGSDPGRRIELEHALKQRNSIRKRCHDNPPQDYVALV